MSRSQKQLLALALLVVVLIGVFLRAFAPRRAASRAAASAEAAAEPMPAASTIPGVSAPQEVLARREAQRARASELSWNRDPFTRGRSVAVGGFTLSGILWDAQQPIAIINGQMLQVGEELDGYRVAEIAQDRVSLTDGTHTYQLLIAP